MTSSNSHSDRPMIAQQEEGRRTPLVKSLWQTADLRERVTLVIGFIYVLSPLDIIPEAVFSMFGLADDAAVIAMLVRMVHKIAERQHDAAKGGLG